MSGKPVILLMDFPRCRSPLLDQFYAYISRNNSPFKVVRPSNQDDLHRPVEEVINEHLDGKLPDYIYWGFSTGSGLVKSKDYLLRNRGKVKIVIDPGDYEQFVYEVPRSVVSNFEPVWVDFITVRCRKIKGYRTMNLIEEYIPTREWLKDAKIINIPWGLNPELYPEKNIERDIDVSLVCTASGHFGYHDERLKAFDVMEELSNEINIVARTYCGPKLVSEEILCDSINPDGTLVDMFGDDYLNILYRSKIFVVTGSGRDFMVQKYCEGPACGAMLLGEIPTPARDFFKDGVSIVEVKDFNNLKEVILKTLEDEERIKQIAAEGRKQIMENFSIDKVSQEFEDVILADWRNKSC